MNDPKGASGHGPPDAEAASPVPARSARWKHWLDVAFWLALAAVLVWRFGPQIGAALGLEFGTPERVPAVRVTTIDGQPLDLASLGGQVVLVNFWATWCGPCRFEMPGFQDVYESRRDRGFTIVGLATDVGAPDLVRSFAGKRGVTYPIAVVGNDIKRAFGGVSAIPTSFLIDRHGCIRHRVTGIFVEATLASAVDRLLAEPGWGAAGGREAAGCPAD